MSDRNMRATLPCVQNAMGERNANMATIPMEFRAIASLPITVLTRLPVLEVSPLMSSMQGRA